MPQITDPKQYNIQPPPNPPPGDVSQFEQAALAMATRDRSSTQIPSQFIRYFNGNMLTDLSLEMQVVPEYWIVDLSLEPSGDKDSVGVGIYQEGEKQYVWTDTVWVDATSAQGSTARHKVILPAKARELTLVLSTPPNNGTVRYNVAACAGYDPRCIF